MAQPLTDGLPVGLRRLWGLEDRPVRGASPALSLERIVAAAIELADAEGLPALSMARLAERLGSAPMSLYRYVESKDELMIFMIDSASTAEPPTTVDGIGWREALRTWANDLMGIYRRHRWILQLPANRPPLEPGQLSWLEAGLRAQEETRLEPGEKLLIAMTLLGYVRGQAALLLDQTAAGDGPAYGELLAKLVEPERFPALSEVIAAGVFEPPPVPADPGLDSEAGFDPDSEPTFGFGLERVLDGVQALIDERSEAIR
ncbi:MAG TPA: TetR/AcrR family transcriptional regulator [Microlunatus sp.]